MKGVAFHPAAATKFARVGAHRDQKEASHPQQLELQAVVSRPTWVLSSSLWSFGRVIRALDY